MKRNLKTLIKDQHGESLKNDISPGKILIGSKWVYEVKINDEFIFLEA